MNDKSILSIANKILIMLIILIFIPPGIYNLNTLNNNIINVNNISKDITNDSEKNSDKTCYNNYKNKNRYKLNISE